jgi:hypothetical protein
VFGRKPGQGLKQVGLPEEVAEKIETEEQLAEVLEQNKADEAGPSEQNEAEEDVRN